LFGFKNQIKTVGYFLKIFLPERSISPQKYIHIYILIFLPLMTYSSLEINKTEAVEQPYVCNE